MVATIPSAHRPPPSHAYPHTRTQPHTSLHPTNLLPYPLQLTRHERVEDEEREWTGEERSACCEQHPTLTLTATNCTVRLVGR